MSKCVGLNQFRHRALIQLKDGGLAHLARFHPDFSLFRSRQGISDENKGDFFLFAQVADARTAFGLEHYKAFFFKNCFPHRAEKASDFNKPQQVSTREGIFSEAPTVLPFLVGS